MIYKMSNVFLCTRRGRENLRPAFPSHSTAKDSPITSSALPNPDLMDRILFGRGCYHCAS